MSAVDPNIQKLGKMLNEGKLAFTTTPTNQQLVDQTARLMFAQNEAQILAAQKATALLSAENLTTEQIQQTMASLGLAQPVRKERDKRQR